MNRDDWNLLVLSAAGGQPLTPVQFQKCLFLLGKTFPDVVSAGQFYDFQPYNYGAFDPDVYSDAESMQYDGLTRITKSGGGWKEYAATAAGIERSEELRKKVPVHVANYIPKLVSWARSLSFADLVRSVYKQYPETRERSIFKG